MRNKTFKLERTFKSFIFKLYQKYILTSLKLFGLLKVFNFFYQTSTFFLQNDILSVKSTFRLLKHNLKQNLRNIRCISLISSSVENQILFIFYSNIC
jgi:hypothetical protein